MAGVFGIETKEELREEIADLALQMMKETKCRNEAIEVERQIAQKLGHQQCWELTRVALTHMGLMHMIEPIQKQMQEIIHAAAREQEICADE